MWRHCNIKTKRTCFSRIMDLTVFRSSVTQITQVNQWRLHCKACREILTFHRFPHSLHSTKVVMGSSALRVWTCGERLRVTFLLVSRFNAALAHLQTSFQTRKRIKMWGFLCFRNPIFFFKAWLKCTNTCVTYCCVTLRLIAVFLV